MFFPRRCPNRKVIIFVAILHVGDILACGADLELKLFDESIHTFASGDTVYSDQVSQMILRGAESDFSRKLIVWVSKNSYRESYAPLYQVDFLGPGRIYRTP